MSERERLIAILNRTGIRFALGKNESYIEIENHCFGEWISVDFNENGEIVDIYC